MVPWNTTNSRGNPTTRTNHRCVRQVVGGGFPAHLRPARPVLPTGPSSWMCAPDSLGRVRKISCSKKSGRCSAWAELAQEARPSRSGLGICAGSIAQERRRSSHRQYLHNVLLAPLIVSKATLRVRINGSPVQSRVAPKPTDLDDGRLNVAQERLGGRFEQPTALSVLPAMAVCALSGALL